MFWISAVVLIVGLPLAVEAGHRVYPLTAGRRDEDDGGAGQLAASALALLGLLIGFTFAMSAERYETRRALVVAEANAIGTVALRDQLLDEPARGRLAMLVAAYAREREAYFQAGDDPAALASSSARTEALQATIWAETGQALRAPNAASLATPVLNATNEMFDLAASREAARQGRVPRPVFWAVGASAVVAALLSGYALAAARRRHRAASTLLFGLVAGALLLILDVDQPRGGLIHAPQSSLAKVARDLSRPQPAPEISPPATPSLDRTPPRTQP